MTLVEFSPWVAAVGLAVFGVLHAVSKGGGGRGAWIMPAVLCVLFLGWSIWTVAAEGPLGFWANHTSDLWGNQVWFDLLLAVGIGWFFVVPQAKAVGMRPLFWLPLVLGTGCIGFLAMVSRLLYLQGAQRSRL